MASDADLAIIGSDAADSFLIGLIPPAVVGVNLNGGEAVPDFDLEVSGTKDLSILGLAGPDLVDGRGVPRAFGKTHLPLQLLSGGGDDDQLFAGGMQSQISGGSGRDHLAGSMGPDLLSGGRGRDTMISGRGKDSVFAVDHKRDLIKCGASRDGAFADRRDKVGRCERVDRATRLGGDPVVIIPF
jgi:Ca2+-binding RTX toxin-like protein